MGVPVPPPSSQTAPASVEMDIEMTLLEPQSQSQIQIPDTKDAGVRSLDVEPSPGTVGIVEQEDVPPDGGYGWVCVACVFGVNLSAWGPSSGAFGVFLAHYLSTSSFPGATPLDYAFVAGLSIAQCLMISPVATHFQRVYSIRTVLFIGAVFVTAGLIGCSFATQIWHLFLAFSGCFGWGTGFVIVGSINIFPQWFSARRSLANGIGTAGVGVGGIVFSLMSSSLIERIGIAWAWRVIALVSGTLMTLCILLVKERNNAVRPNPVALNLRLLRRPEVLLFLGWGAFSEIGYVVLSFSLPSYATSIGLSASKGAIVGALLNLGAVIGRPTIGFLSDTRGRLNVTTVVMLTCGILCLTLWIYAKIFSVLCIFALLIGMICGTFWATVGPVGVEVVGLKDLPSTLSTTFLCLVIPATCSEAIALKLRRNTGDIFLYSQLFTGTMFLLSAICSWLLRSYVIVKGERDAEIKRRREDATPHPGDNSRFPEADQAWNGYSRHWIIDGLKALVAVKRV